jgi:phosphate-selective porin
MEVAAAVTVGDVPDGLNSLRGRTTFNEPFFTSVYVKGRRVRLGFDADWRPGPFSVKGEFIRVTDQRKNQGIFDDDLPDLVSRGWYVSGSWVVTGEPKLNEIEPRAPLFRGGFGALELATRVERLGFGSTLEGEPELTNPRAANLLETGLRAWTGGINWYLNRWVKIQFNAIRELIEDPEQGPDSDRAVFWTRVVRLQFVL